MTPGSSGFDDGDSLERKLAEFIGRHEDGEAVDLDEFCASMGDRAGALRAIIEEFLGVDSALKEPIRPEETVQVTGASWADPNWGRYVSQLKSRGPSYQRYTLLGEIGRGGMGAVLRVRDNDTRRDLAMKVIKGQGVGPLGATTPIVKSKDLGRFLEEAQVTAQLDHPGIVPVHEVGVDDDGRVYFTMKLVKGQTLREFLDSGDCQNDPRQMAAAIRILHQVCEAVQYAHDKGVIHRDLKPENIMVGSYGETYVMDWGLAGLLDRGFRAEPAVPEPTEHRIRTERGSDDSSTKGTPNLTRTDEVMGTPSYMSPEQADARHEEVGPRSDVYSIGAILYRMISGIRPYEAPDRGNLTVVQRVRSGPPEPVADLAPHAPLELVAICEKAMARSIADRYQSVRELGEDLQAWLQGRAVRAFGAGPWFVLKKWVRRNRLVATLTAAVFLAVPSSVAFFLIGARNAALAEKNAALLATQESKLAQTDSERRRLEAENLLRLEQEAQQRAQREQAEAQATRDVEFARERARQECTRRILELEIAEGRALALSKDLPSIDGFDIATSRALRRWLNDVEELRSKVPIWEGWKSELAVRGVRSDDDRRERDALDRAFAASTSILDAKFQSNVIAARRKRLAELEAIETASLVSAAEAWQAAIERVRVDPRFAGFSLEPRFGLVPIGPDTNSGLEEFAHTAIGTIFVLLPPGRATSSDPSADSDAEPSLPPSRALADLIDSAVVQEPIFVAKSELTRAHWSRIAALVEDLIAESQVPRVDISAIDAVPALARYAMRLPTLAENEIAVRTCRRYPGLLAGLDSDPWEWCRDHREQDSQWSWISNGTPDPGSAKYGVYRRTPSDRSASWIGIRCVIPWRGESESVTGSARGVDDPSR